MALVPVDAPNLVLTIAHLLADIVVQVHVKAVVPEQVKALDVQAAAAVAQVPAVAVVAVVVPQPVAQVVILVALLHVEADVLRDVHHRVAQAAPLDVHHRVVRAVHQHVQEHQDKHAVRVQILV